jgi:membrane complex biogenesis BtpA family protein
VFKRSPSPALIGVIHLLPLPGGPSKSPGLEGVCERALTDARTLAAGGIDGVILENYGDAPFAAGRADAYTIAAMTRIANAIRAEHPALALGINVLRNDGLAALGIAAASGADFIRINVYTGVTATDQGLIEGNSRELHLERNRIGQDVRFAADVHVKHGTPLQNQPIEESAEDAFLRGKADAVILTGSSTGRPTSLDELARVRAVIPAAPLWVGSGVEPAQASKLAGIADALIVGTWFRGASLSEPVQLSRVEALRKSLRTSV